MLNPEMKTYPRPLPARVKKMRAKKVASAMASNPKKSYATPPWLMQARGVVHDRMVREGLQPKKYEVAHLDQATGKVRVQSFNDRATAERYLRSHPGGSLTLLVKDRQDRLRSVPYPSKYTGTGAKTFFMGKLFASNKGKFKRTRIASPKEYDPKSFRTITPGSGRHRMVVGCPKGKYRGGKCAAGMEVQSVLTAKNATRREGQWVGIFSDDDHAALRYWRDLLKREGVRARITDNTPYVDHKALEIWSECLREALRVSNQQEGRSSRLSEAIRFSAGTHGLIAPFRRNPVENYVGRKCAVCGKRLTRRTAGGYGLTGPVGKTIRIPYCQVCGTKRVKKVDRLIDRAAKKYENNPVLASRKRGSKLEYRTINVRTLRGLKEAERLKAQGWTIGSVGFETIQFYKRNPGSRYDKPGLTRGEVQRFGRIGPEREKWMKEAAEMKQYEDWEFPPPPVPTGRWKHKDWVNYIRWHGRPPTRKNPGAGYLVEWWQGPAGTTVSERFATDKKLFEQLTKLREIGLRYTVYDANGKVLEEHAGVRKNPSAKYHMKEAAQEQETLRAAGSRASPEFAHYHVGRKHAHEDSASEALARKWKQPSQNPGKPKWAGEEFDPPGGIVLSYFPVNQAWGFVWGHENLFDIRGKSLFRSKREAIDAAKAAGLSITEKGHLVSANPGRAYHKREAHRRMEKFFSPYVAFRYKKGLFHAYRVEDRPVLRQAGVSDPYVLSEEQYNRVSAKLTELGYATEVVGANPGPAYHKREQKRYSKLLAGDLKAGHKDAAEYWQGALSAEAASVAAGRVKRNSPLMEKAKSKFKQYAGHASKALREKLAQEIKGNPLHWFNVYLGGKLIDEIPVSSKMTAESVRRSLVEHDHYDPRIRVTATRATVSKSEKELLMARNPLLMVVPNKRRNPSNLAYHRMFAAAARERSVPEQHQLKIALSTLRMAPAMARVMGGMSHDEAKTFLKSVGYTDAQIAKLAKNPVRPWYAECRKCGFATPRSPKTTAKSLGPCARCGASNWKLGSRFADAAEAKRFPAQKKHGRVVGTRMAQALGKTTVRRGRPQIVPNRGDDMQSLMKDPRFAKAVALYRKFHGCDPKSISRRLIPVGGKQLNGREFFVSLGKAPSESYTPPKRSKKAGNIYVHPYDRKPEKVVSADGKTIITLPGSHKVTDWIRG
jgi:hypothetical protein